MTSPIIDSLKAQIADRWNALKSNPAMGELLKLHAALNNVEDVENVPRTSLVQLFGLEDTQAQSGIPASAVVQPGQYFDKTPLDAAKDYLTRRGRSATLDEIIAAVKTGSCDPGNREKFGTSMARSTFNFVKLSDDIYDLLDRYPNVKEKRQSGNAKRKATPDRIEEIMRVEAPISFVKAVAKAESEEQAQQPAEKIAQ